MTIFHTAVITGIYEFKDITQFKIYYIYDCCKRYGRKMDKVRSLCNAPLLQT